MKIKGVNLVRIPVPHFIFGEKKPYVGCIEYLDKAFDWGEKYGLKILIDLHTVPDSQNGFDNGGLTGVVKWHHKPENIEYTLDVLDALAERYAGRSNLYGIELLNEPISEAMWQVTRKRYHARDPKRAEGSTSVPTELLKDFYLRGYEVVRRHCGDDVAVVLHDGFRLEEWEDFMREPEYKNVVIDTHMYVGGLESHMESREMADYAREIEENFEKALERAQQYHQHYQYGSVHGGENVGD